MHIRTILVSLLVLLSLGAAIAQQVWPVQVSGALIPPRSLDLAVYGTDRPNDLLYSLLLNDPVRPSLQVQLRLSIEQGGEVIYQTVQNPAVPPLVINQFQSLDLTGADLQPYLDPMNLTGQGNMGTGSTRVPEGFTSICVQVFGVERNVPVSRKFCLQGSFQLNQVPQPLVPACGASVTSGPTQNLTFNWAPMHLGSSNSPAPVEYVFQLRELADASVEPNDGFVSSVEVTEQTVLSTSINLDISTAPLTPNRYYAWRVIARSMMHPSSVLFQNDGASEVCSFFYAGESDEESSTGGDDTASNDQNNNAQSTPDNPAPTGCVVFNTDYGLVSNTRDRSGDLVEGEIVKLGFFPLTISSANKNGTSYSGEGTVDFPLFNTRLQVEFTGMKVNTDGRVYGVTSAKAKVDDPYALTEVELEPNLIGNRLDQAYVADLDNFFENGLGTSRKVSQLNIANPNAITLPLAMDRQDSPMIVPIDIRFTDQKALLTLVSWLPAEAGNQLRFAATNVEAVPTGLKQGKYLELLNGGSQGAANQVIPSIEMSFRDDPNEKGKIFVNCTGFQGSELPNDLRVTSTVLERADNGMPVVLSLPSDANSFQDYLGQVQQIPDFKITGLDDWTFSAGNGALDLRSAEKLLFQNALPDVYRAPELPNWRGLVINDLGVQVPGEYNLTQAGTPLQLSGGRLFLNDEGVAYGSVETGSLVSIDQGVAGKWRYSMDRLALVINGDAGPLVRLSGQLLPDVISEGFTYDNPIFRNTSNEVVLLANLPDEEKDFLPFAGKIQLDTSSRIKAVITNLDNGDMLLAPSATLKGKLSISLTDQAFRDKFEGDVQPVLDALLVSELSFDLKDLEVKSLNLNPLDEPDSRYVGTLGLTGTTLKIGDANLAPGDFTLTHYPEVNTGADQAAERLSLSFSATRNAKRVELTFWSRWTPQGWEFYRIEGASRTVECECVGQLMRPTDEEWDGILNRVIDRYYADLFQLPKQVGGRSSADGDPELPSWQQELRAALKEELRDNAVSDLPMLNDSTVIIPFLGEEIEVRRSSGIYTGKVSKEITDTTRFTDLDELTSGQLPIDISDRLSQLGITDGSLPENARLYVTGFKMGSQQGAWTAAKMELTLFYQLYDYGADANEYLRFVRDSIDVGPEQVNMTDLFLELENYGTLPTDGGDQVHLGMLNAIYLGENAPRHAKLSCDGGFSHFEVAGLYQAFYESDPESTKTKLLFKKPMEGRDYLDANKRAQAFYLPFTVDTRKTPTHSLSTFIVPIDSLYRGGVLRSWEFSAKGSEQVLFLPGRGFSGYIDLDPNAAPDEALEGDSGDKVNDPG
ncbi:MAG: hypothetical protein AAGA31_12255, partial [Bacteroidota bacterium]